MPGLAPLADLAALRARGGLRPAAARQMFIPRSMARSQRSSRPLTYVPLALRAPAADEGGGGGGWWQVPKGLFAAAKGLPAGIAHLGAQAGRTLYRLPDFARDVVTGETEGMGWRETLHEYVPLGEDVATSIETTIGDIRHPSRFKKAWDEGTIVSKVLEDAGNVAIVGGAASKALGASGRGAGAAGAPRLADTLTTAGRGARRVSTLGNTIANTPFDQSVSLARRAGRFGATRTLSGLERMSRLDPAAHPRSVRFARNLRKYTPFSPEGRVLRAGARDIGVQRGRAGVQAARGLRKVETEQGVTLAEQGAAVALRTGLGDVNRLATDLGYTLDEAQRATTPRDIPEQTLTPDVAAIVDAYHQGTLDPEARARIDTYGEAIEGALEPNRARALAGEGRPGGPLDPRHEGNDPFVERIDSALADEGAPPLTVAGQTWEQTLAANPAADVATFVRDASSVHPRPDLVGSILDNPGTYAAKWRPAMRSAGLLADDYATRTAAGTLAAGGTIPRRPADLLAAGVPEPRYLPGGRSELVDPSSSGTGRQPYRNGITGVQGLGSEKFRAAAERQPFSGRTIAEKVGNEAAVTTTNQGLVEMMRDPNIRDVRTALDPAELRSIEAEAQRLAAAQRGTPKQIADATREKYGELVEEALAARGLELLVGDRSGLNVGDFKPGDRVRYADVNADTIVLPKGLKGRLIPYMVGKDMHAFFRTLDKINSKWKGAVLPGSIRWQMGDAVGGLFMAATGGGILPPRMISAMTKLRKLSPEGKAALLEHPNLQKSGLNFEEVRWQHRGIDAPREPRTPIGKLARGSFKFNEGINRVNRQGYALAKLQRVLDEQGLSLDGVERGGLWDDPTVQRSIEAAVDDANRVMGTFDEMSPFERRTMRTIFPFWTWYRHVTQLAWRMAIDNPARMMWTLRLGDIGTDDEELPPWLEGALHVNGGRLPLTGLNPLADVDAENSIYTPAGAIASTSPGLKMIALALGRDPNNELRPLTRPYDAGGMDPLGREGGFRLLSPAELGYQVLRQFPQTREAMNVLPTTEVAGVGLGPHPRYGSGAFLVESKGRNRGEPIDTLSRWESARRVLGIPWTTPDERVEEIMDTARERERLARLRAAKTVRYGD